MAVQKEILDNWDLIVEDLSIDEKYSSAVSAWMNNVSVMALNQTNLTLSVPNPMVGKQIKKRLAEPLLKLTAEHTPYSPSEIVTKITSESMKTHQQAVERSSRSAATNSTSNIKKAKLKTNPKFTLDEFVVGNCNAIAYNAIRILLEEPERAVSPLFIHSSSGLGKTHLLQGLAMAFAKEHPSYNIKYLSSDQFMTAYVEACGKGHDAINAFRVSVRDVDLLILDDLHFLGEGQKEKTKEELFATIKEINETGGKVVVSSDAPPSQIKNLEQGFRDKFNAGLIVRLERPRVDVRRSIVIKKASAHNIKLGEEVVNYISDHITDNVRELEGAVNKIIYSSNAFGRKPDLTIARTALEELLGKEEDNPRLRSILRCVADKFNITSDEILGKERSEPIPFARHIAMFIYKQCTNETYQAVGELFGGKTHAAVSNACRNAIRHSQTDEELKNFIEDLILKIKRR